MSEEEVQASPELLDAQKEGGGVEAPVVAAKEGSERAAAAALRESDNAPQWEFSKGGLMKESPADAPEIRRRNLEQINELVPALEIALGNTQTTFRETMASFKEKIKEMKARGEASTEGIFLDEVNKLDSDMEAVGLLMRDSMEKAKAAPQDTDEVQRLRQDMQDFSKALKDISDRLGSIQSVIVERADNPDMFIAFMHAPLDKMKDLLRRIKTAY